MDLAYRTGEPQRFETELAELGRWFDNYITRLGGEDDDRVLGVFGDITERKLAERTLRESEERQVFLLRVSDALRPIKTASEVQRVATQMLGEQLGASRVFYVVVSSDGDTAEISSDYTNGVPSRVGRYSLSDFSSHGFHEWRSGRTASTEDVDSDPRYSEAARDAYASVPTRAGFGVPLVKDGQLVAILGVNQSTPRHWSEQELSLTTEIAERTWAAIERTRAEAALRESEARFAQFARASAAALWIRDADTLSMEFASRAIATIYGIEPDAILDDEKRWAALIVPDDRALALEHVDRARQGEAVVHEFRIQRPTDGAFRWIRNTDFPLFDARGQVQRIGGIAEDVTEAKLAVEHQGVLLAELQHRVRNIMALVRSITARTGERAQSVTDYRELMLGRLLAFARVQALLTRAANASVGIASIVRDEVSVQAQHEEQYILDGPNVELSPKAAEVLTLAVHELATNAAKYGALSVPGGQVTVRWSTFEKRGGTWLSFDWTEAGAPERPEPTPDTPRRHGFGSELIEGRVPYELKGRGTIVIELGGARCHLEFPLVGGASILETGAPQRATVFGGALDMTGEPDLSGHRVLVVEDDYYLATDTARALQGVGAKVLGPCPTEQDARAEMAEQRPDAVVLDINLGTGASFKLAEHLKDSGIPFVFVTGYDQEVIPSEFEGVERLEKPLQLRQVVGSVSRLLMQTD